MKLVRYISTKRKLAVIGSGPSAFYTILNLLKEKPNDFEIDMFEKNPSPFGLVRYGVAPDHPEVKNCINRFNDIKEFLNNGTFKYFGNTPISTKNSILNLNDLYKNYNLILFAYGSSIPNLPINFKNLNHFGIIDSFSLVNWYNNNSNFKNLNLPFEKIKNLSIIGNGNVSIDITRLLLNNNLNYLKNTDISENILNKLTKSDIKNINIIARRGILESKFSNKELRELLEMDEKFGIYFTGYNLNDFKDQLNDIKLDRINKRRISLLNKYMEKFQNLKDKSKIRKTWNLQYLKDPIGVKIKDNELLSETIFKENKLIKNVENNNWEIKSTNKLISIPNDFLILSTGYKNQPLLDFEKFNIPFKNNKIENINGKIIGVKNSYCVGWISNGSNGNINDSLIDSINTSNSIINDLNNDDTNFVEKKGRIEIQDKLLKNRAKIITWNDWIKIHELEKSNGEKLGKPYEKLDFNEMIDYVN
ncbi:NADPH-adrenodoxin reductase [Pichia californica]|nr:NADPH-adrenodoxin reductase [[Candida] californica]